MEAKENILKLAVLVILFAFLYFIASLTFVDISIKKHLLFCHIFTELQGQDCSNVFLRMYATSVSAVKCSRNKISSAITLFFRVKEKHLGK